MKIPDLWLLIKSLEGKEHTRIRKFLASPYFNSDEKQVKLFEAVVEQVKEARCDREALDTIIFPYKPFSYTRITNLISDLKRLLESFFIQEELKKQPFSSEFLLLQSMNAKALPKFIGQSEERIKNQVEGKTIHTEEFFLQNFLVEDQIYQFFSVTDEKRSSEIVGKKVKALHLFYVMAMLRSVCQDLNQRANHGTDGKTSHRFFIQYVLDNQKLYSHELMLRLYMLILRMLVTPTDIHYFERLVDELTMSKDNIPQKEFWTLFKYAQQHSLRMKGNHSLQVKTLLFRLYSVFMNGSGENWAITKDFLSPTDGFAFLTLAVEFQKEKAAEKFISDYATYSPNDNQILAFYQAYFLYKMKNKRKESLEIMQLHNFDDTPFVKDAPFLLTELYYEAYEDQALEKLW